MQISVDDDGTVGVVSMKVLVHEKVTEAERQIRLIVNPPTADVGAEYEGRVVDIASWCICEYLARHRRLIAHQQTRR